jgi:RNA 3'-terminal phosphate cyclase (ATP)
MGGAPRAAKGARVLEIDGAHGSGSGTIVRFAVALAAITGRPLRVVHARARRAKPGLRPQHLAAVRACAELCDAETEGLAVGAQAFSFAPRRRPRAGSYAWDIGTAGSATMLALGVLPVACLADGPVVARLSGGTFQDFAPSPFHLAHVVAPLLGRMGARVELALLRPGHPPEGGGLLELRVTPAPGALAALSLPARGALREVRGVAFASRLAERRVSERMAAACEEWLARAGLAARIERVDDTAADRPGAALAAWSVHEGGALLGADRAGARGRTSEAIGRFVAARLLEDLGTDASVDRHAADQLVIFGALARGMTRYAAPRATEHLDTNLWLVGRFGARAERRDGAVTVDGLALGR